MHNHDQHHHHPCSEEFHHSAATGANPGRLEDPHYPSPIIHKRHRPQRKKKRGGGRIPRYPPSPRTRGCVDRGRRANLEAAGGLLPAGRLHPRRSSEVRGDTRARESCRGRAMRGRCARRARHLCSPARGYCPKGDSDYAHEAEERRQVMRTPLSLVKCLTFWVWG